MSKLLKKIIVLGLTIALISNNLMYIHAEEYINEKTNDSNTETNDISILEEEQLEQIITNSNDKPIPFSVNESIETTTQLSVPEFYIGEIQETNDLSNIPNTIADLPENTDPNYAYAVNPDKEYSGNIQNEKEVRWYAFNISQTSKVSILVIPDTSLDADVLMFKLDQSTMQLTPTDMNASAGVTGEDEYFSYVMEEGVYYFAIYGYSGTGSYILDFFCNANYFDLEINDVIESSQIIPYEGTFSGTIDTTRDVDFYKINLSKPVFLQVSFTGRVNYNFQWILTSEDEVITLYDNQTFLLSSGTHYFRIYSPQSLYSPSEKYTIGLKAIQIDDPSDPANTEIAPATEIANWNYTLDNTNNTITLNYYIGSDTDVIVYSNYKIGKTLYKTKIASNTELKRSNYMFANKFNVKSIKFGENIVTSNTTGMACMFYNCNSLADLDISKLDTSNVTSMYRMFYYCSSLKTIDLRGLNTSKVTNMYGTFESCLALTSLLGGFDTSKVTTMQYMFYKCQSIPVLDLSYFDTANVTTMCYMFENCRSLIDVNVSSFNTLNVREFGSMFEGCSKLQTLDISNFYLNSVPKYGNMSCMFKNCPKLYTIYVNSSWQQRMNSTIYPVNKSEIKSSHSQYEIK